VGSWTGCGVTGSRLRFLLLRPGRLTGNGERPVRTIVETALETGRALGGGTDVEADGPAAVQRPVPDAYGEPDGHVALLHLVAGPFLELVPAVQQAALRGDATVDAAVHRHHVPLLNGTAEHGRHHVAALVVRLPVHLGHAVRPLGALEVGPLVRVGVQVAGHLHRHRCRLAVLALHRRLGHRDRVLADQRIRRGRARVVSGHHQQQQRDRGRGTSVDHGSEYPCGGGRSTIVVRAER